MVIHYDVVHVQLKKKKITVTFDQNLFQFFRWNKKKAVGKLLVNVFR